MKNARAQHTTGAGFSLAEVLTALTIVAVLFAIAAPQIPAYRAQFHIATGARQIAIELQRARMKAVGENAFYRLSFYGDGSYVRQSSADGITFTNDGVPVQLPTGIRFAGGLPQPTFNRLGTVAADASVMLTNDLGQAKVVQINTLGKITIS